MSQTQLLDYVRNNITNMRSHEFQEDLKKAKEQIEDVVSAYGEAGLMAVALIGLEQASKAEQEGIPPIEGEKHGV